MSNVNFHRVGLWIVALASCGYGFMPALRPAGAIEPKEWVLLISGNTEGYLSPCGCTKPMSGGIKRRATMLKQLTVPHRTVILETGRFTTGTGPQDRFKAEAMADAVAAWKVDGVAFTSAEAAWPEAQQSALRDLAGPRVLDAPKEIGPFKISTSESDGGVGQIVILDGDRTKAEQYAASTSPAQLVIYQQKGRPDGEPFRNGKTWMVSPGEKGKYVLRLTFRAGEFRSYQVFDLGPEVKDDPVTTAIFRRYQRRVSDSNLIESVPRSASAAFAGNDTCMSCHAEAAKVWKGSAHSHAQKTLEDEGHGRDPECVSCHVVGLDLDGGYISRAKTPQLADVGCESCHGPGRHTRTIHTSKRWGRLVISPA